jgi:hypothetical protein
MKNLQRFYPVLFGVYFALGLISSNIDQMRFAAGVRSILLGFLFSLLVHLFLHWRIQNKDKASLLSAVFLLFFFTYGHVYDALEGIQVAGLTLGRHRFLMPLWLLGFLGLGIWIYRRSWKLAATTRFLFAMSLILLVMPIAQIGVYEWGRYRSVNGQAEQSQSGGQSDMNVSTENLPDIYYIILDGYPRQDALQKYMDFDNQIFVERLEELGFTVPACTQSNYAMTVLSLSSSLNMNYVNALGDGEQANLEEKILNSQTWEILKSWGYRTVALESSIWFTDLQDADHYISQKQPVWSSFFDLSLLSEFEVMYIRTTLLRLLEEAKTAWLDSLFDNPRKELYNLIQFQLDQLEEVPQIQGPKFVFAHILAPHAREAYFNAQGEFDYSLSDDALNEEFQYLNQRTLQIVQTILAESQNPPVIIIQGDHGLDSEARMAILNAYYLPGDGVNMLYPTITPVNSFRIVFNTYFGQNFPLLPDVSLYSRYDDMYNFSEVLYPCNP